MGQWRVGRPPTGGRSRVTSTSLAAAAASAAAGGFAVNPAQFYYGGGSFTDRGTVQSADPSGHQVAPGSVYQFSIDYSHLSADPSAGKGGGWVYAPGTPVAVWR